MRANFSTYSRSCSFSYMRLMKSRAWERTWGKMGKMDRVGAWRRSCTAVKHAQPEAEESSECSSGCRRLTSHLATPCSAHSPHSSTVTLPAKWTLLWNLAGQAAHCLEDMSLTKLHFTQTASAGSHEIRVWSQHCCTKWQHRARGAMLTVR